MEDIAISNNIVRQPHAPVGQQDMAELGALIQASGLGAGAARALVAEVQQAGIQVALSVVPGLLERIRTLSFGRLADMHQRIAMLPNYMGYIRRDQVMTIIAAAMHTNPPVT